MPIGVLLWVLSSYSQPYNRFRMLKKGVLLLKDLFFPREIFIFALKWNCYEQI